MVPVSRVVSSLVCVVLLAPACSDDGAATETLLPGGSSGSGEASTGEPEPTGGGSGGGSSSSTGEPEPSPWDGEPLPDAPPGQWTWVPFPDARCRDGSETGIGIRHGTGDGLVIYFQGGGACFNTLTCASNPSSFGAGNFASASSSLDGGIFDVDAGKNPVGDWNFVFVPYCTGDVHAGDRADQAVPDVGGVQQFVGYRNVAAYLERIVPTWSGVGHVLVTGESAGGFGAAFNYDRIADAFPDTRVTLLDDSGPPLGDDVVAPCLQQTWRDLWGFDDTIPADCADCFPADGGGIIQLARYIGDKHRDQRLALISSTGDSVIRFFFGFGADECMALLPSTSQAAFEAGLLDARDNFFNEPDGVWGTFLVGGSDQHTWLSGSYYSATVGGVTLVDWVRQLLDGQASHVGP